MDKSHELELVVVIPVYNEQACISEVITSWSGFLDNLCPNYKILVINDGSKDNTKQVLDEQIELNKKLIVFHQENKGHGGAIYTGYSKALELNPKWIFQVDGDNQFKAQDFIKLWDRRTQSNFILGYRMIRHDDLVRLIITRLLKFLNLIIFNVWLDDANIPFRLMNSKFLRELIKVLPSGLFAPNIFLAILAQKTGANLYFIPVTHAERKTGTVSIIRLKLLKVCLRCFIELVLFRWQLRNSLKYLKSKVSTCLI